VEQSKIRKIINLITALLSIIAANQFLREKSPHFNLTHTKFIRKRKILENYFGNHSFLISGVFGAPISRYTAASLDSLNKENNSLTKT
tara:strand:+ start:181 stop:444 length:264 start_codon:yes stop_codon:yes gene_type:complete